jgi:flagellar biosynthesis/type III secretory pathway protein FliH
MTNPGDKSASRSPHAGSRAQKDTASKGFETGPAEEAKAEVKESARQLRDKAAEVASTASEKARKKAKNLAQTAKDKARSKLEEVRERASERVETAAEAVDAAREKLPDGALEERALDRVASAIRDVSEAISDTRLEGVIADVEAFARRNPLLFAAGAAALGFAVARTAKASERRRTPHYLRHHYGDE